MNAQPTFADQEWLDALISIGTPVMDSQGVVHDGTDKVAQAAAQERMEAGKNKALPSIISVVPTHSAYEIKVRCLDGTVEHLFPVVRWGNMDTADWYEFQIQKCKTELVQTDDEAEMSSLTARIRDFEWKKLRLHIEDVPQDLWMRLDPAQRETIWYALERMDLDSKSAAWEAKKKLLEPYLVKREP